MTDHDWTRDLRHYKHSCGQPLLVGLTFNGYQEWPVFQTEPGRQVTCCPDPCCGRKLNLNDCQQVQAPRQAPVAAGPILWRG